MPMNKDLLAPKEISRQELKVMVDEWVANGGVITQCDPGVALNFRTAETPKVSRPKSIKILLRKGKIKTTGKSKKPRK